MNRCLPIGRSDSRVGAMLQQQLHDLEIAGHRRADQRRRASRRHHAARVRRLEEELHVRIGAALEQQLHDREAGGRVRGVDGRAAAIDAPNTTTGLAIVKLLLERGANPNMQLTFKPANARGAINTRGATPLIRAAVNADAEVVKLLLEKGADATLYTADRQTPIHAVLAGRAPEPQALELIKVLQKAGTDVNVVALINHPEEIRGGTALHYAVRKRYKDAIKLLASFKIDMDAVDQDGLTALDYTQSRGFMPFMALQTPIFKEEAALLRELGATRLMAKSPEWPVLGPPQGVWDDIWPLGESRVHDPVYRPKTD
jgi:ankyrin repeat protein